MRVTTRLAGDYNVATLSQVRQALLTARLDLNRLDRVLDTKTEAETALMRKVQEVINECCTKLSILEGELTNAGIQ